MRKYKNKWLNKAVRRIYADLKNTDHQLGDRLREKLRDKELNALEKLKYYGERKCQIYKKTKTRNFLDLKEATERRRKCKIRRHWHTKIHPIQK